MNEPDSEGGWTFVRIIGALVGLIGMVGFGVCGLLGLVISANGGLGASDGFIFLLALAGLALAALFFMLVRAMFRNSRRKPPDPPAS